MWRCFCDYCALGFMAMIALSLFGYEFTLTEMFAGAGVAGLLGFLGDKLFGFLVTLFPRQFALDMSFPNSWEEALKGPSAISRANRTLRVYPSDKEFVVAVWLKYNVFGRIRRPEFIKFQCYEGTTFWTPQRLLNPLNRLHPQKGLELTVIEGQQLKWRDHFDVGKAEWKRTADGGGFRVSFPDPPLWLLGDPLVLRVRIEKRVAWQGVLQCQVVTSDDHELVKQQTATMR